MKYRSSKLTGLILIGLSVLILGLTMQGQMQAASLLQSPLPEPSTPCISQTSNGFTLEVFGYVDNGDGTTALTYRVTNVNKKDISYMAFGLGSWSAVAPADGSTYSGGLGDYNMEWTNNNGNPGFPSIKYETLFDGFSKGAQDTIALTVSNFDPNESIQIQMKAGKDKTTFTLALDDPLCDQTPVPTATPMATATVESPLATPTAVPTVEFPNTEVHVLNSSLFETEFSEAEKEERWSLGLPVPLVNINEGDEVTVAEGAAALHSKGHRKPGLLSFAPQVNTQVIDNWQEEDIEYFEGNFPNMIDDCLWTRTQRASGGQEYVWGISSERSISGAHSIWPAGAVNQSAPIGTQPLPENSAYPADMITSMVCKLPGISGVENILAEFQMWYELADNGDSMSVQFFSGADDGNDMTLNYKGGLEWRGSANGLVSHDWRKYHIYYPSLMDSGDTIWVKWKFSSDSNDNQARGPWLDDVAVSTYQKPTSSVNCQNSDPAYASNLSKGLNIGPYTEDLKFGDPAKFDQMISRLTSSGVNWVRMEFSVNPSYFTLVNSTDDPIDPLVVLDGDNHIDLRQYDLFVDSLCALNSDGDPNNDIAILGLVDNTTLIRQDWQDSNGNGNGVVVPNGYLSDFADVTGQLAEYYDDRIGAWEVWNEPDYSKSGLAEVQYAVLLNEIHNVLKAADFNDQVLFTGLVGANGTAQSYFNNTITSLLSPKPFDVFALHPYFTEAYPGRNGEIAELDPAYYMRGDIDGRPQTIVKKFRETLDGINFLPEEHGKPIWATEVGWNSSEGSMACSNFLQIVTDENEQACYLQRGFHSLFNLSPTVSKVFWFTYHDTGQTIDDAECGAVIDPAFAQLPSPSWVNSDVGEYFVRASAAPNTVIPWSFGLYRGNIHLDVPETEKEKPVQSAFQNWPNADISCISPWPNLPTTDELAKLYLPFINNGSVVASGQ